jgi:hypothetical protein
MGTDMLDKADTLLRKGNVREAHAILIPIAEGDDLRAINKLAASLARDLKDFAQAESWARRGVAVGEASPLYSELGRSEHILAMVLESLGVLSEAEQWCLRSMEKGWPVAWISYQRILRDRGKLQEARNFLSELASKGHPHARRMLGSLEFENDNAPENFDYL